MFWGEGTEGKGRWRWEGWRGIEEGWGSEERGSERMGGGEGEGREGKLIETEMNCNDHNGKGSHNGTNMGTLH